MTRDEAIKWLQGIEERYFHGGDEDFDKRRREAVRMAIEALEQYENAFEHGYIEAESEYREILEQNRGEWIPHEIQVPWGDGTTGVTMFRCSVCGYEQDWQSKFCANCGADMRERRKSDE